MTKSIFILTLLFFYQLASSQASNSLSKKFDDLVTRAVKAENDSLFEKAIILIDSAVAIDSMNYSTYTIKSEVLWLQKRYAEAAQNLKKAILLDNDSTLLFGAHLLLGVLYEKAKMREEAQAQYLRALYLFETKKREQDRLFEDINRIDYAISLCLSGNKLAWEKILNESPYKEALQKYVGKSREEVLELYFKQYGG